jgi:NADPH2:quinone reductase
VTAAYCVLGDGPVEGKVVLVQGGAGGVGRAAVEIAKWAGATVVATASTPERQEVARQAGADFVFDYRDPDIIFDIREAVGSVDRIIEVNLSANLEMDLEVSKPDTVVVVYASTGADIQIPTRQLMTAGLVLEFMLLYTVAADKLATAVSQVESALAEGALTMPPVRYFELDDIVSAHETQEAGAPSRLVIRL